MQRPKRKSTSTTKPKLPDDPVTAYALAVLEQRIVAGPHVRAACKRHITDLEQRNVTGLQWDISEVERVIGFFSDVLTVEIEEKDDDGFTVSKAVPFILEPWQCFVVGSLFGWKTAQGFRRYRRAYVEIGKGNGKSPIAAGIGHYMLTATKKLRAEVYSAATDRDQAAILFRDAVSMWRRSPGLTKRLRPMGDTYVWQLTHVATESFFKPISSEKKGKSGIRPYCALIDEVHEHPNMEVIEMLRAGTKGNQQALIFEITNSGFDPESVCWKEHEYTIKVVEGTEVNQSWFGFICSLDPGDDPFKDESCWIKANPNLGVSIHPEYIREQVQEAKGMPSKEALVRRLHFCEWVGSGKTWVTREMWEKIEAPFKLEEYKGESCFLGLDMSFTQDLTAMAYVFPTGNDNYDAFIEYWTPKETMMERAKRDGFDYPLYVKQGHIFATEGKVIKLDHVALRIQWAMDNLKVLAMAYDNYRHKELAVELDELGVNPPLVEHPQGFRRGRPLENIKDKDGKPMENPLWMPGSFTLTENAVIEGRLRVAINPVTRANVASVAVRDDPSGVGNRVFDKKKATGHIDGIVALAMAMGAAAIRRAAPTRSVYELLAEEGGLPPEPAPVLEDFNPFRSSRWDTFRMGMEDDD